jgi:hypothetical protein
MVILGVLLLLAIGALVFPSFFEGIVAKAFELRARRELMSVSLASLGFHKEYDRFPAPPTATDESQAVETTGKAISALTGVPSSLNLRQIRFLDLSPSHNGRTGLVTTATGSLELYDPWGTPYQMHFDFDRDGYIPDPENPGARIKAQMLMYSAGQDRDPGTWEDNLKNWK